MKKIRGDFVFSFWIFAWYLLFIYKYIQYSPKVALIFGIIHNTFILINMIIYKNNIFNILFFCIINTFIKIIPLWTLRNNKRYDIIATIIIFSIYLFWLYLNNINLYDIYITQLENIKNNKEVGPVTKFFNKIFNKNI